MEIAQSAHRYRYFLLFLKFRLSGFEKLELLGLHSQAKSLGMSGIGRLFDEIYYYSPGPRKLTPTFSI